ncbi:hypothetical protein LAG90_12275 [Marinilongibacter aquaticus]|uniref:hypothetical protein n=1 Tax=Marinilongibacter aquaticus TaxID=2975157 RepID=UPI0021BD72BC|nr:hypothetical protein [Marinilongibacter aquaticus]UBM57592.1 hypothetical protein LAG90_12275 [Marinilongibacter aquaticus]
MKNMVHGYPCWEGDNFYRIVPSKVFETELYRQLKKIAQDTFGELLVWKQVYFLFEELPIRIDEKGVKCSFGYWSMFSFRCRLYAENTKGQGPVDCRDDFEPGSLEFSLEFDPGQKESAEKTMRAYLSQRKIRVIPDYRFGVKIHSHGIDVEVDIAFTETQSKEDIENFFRGFSAIVDEFNQKVLAGEHAEKGLIHSFDMTKGHTRATKKITISMDTGSSGEFGLEYIFEKLAKGSQPIKSILVK